MNATIARGLDAGQRAHLLIFLLKVFEVLHPGAPPLHPAWYLRAICHALESARSGTRLAIAVPPRHLKSIIASVAWPAWLLGLDPSRKILVATYSEDLARQHASDFRRILSSAWYRRLFPGTVIATNGNRLLDIETTAGGGRKSVSVGGSVTGHGGDVIIIDDCMKAEDVRSQARRDEIKAWYEGTLSTRLNSLGGGVMISIQQRLHEDDLPAFLIDKGYALLNLPAIAERDEEIALAAGFVHRRLVGDLLGRPDHSRATLEAERRNMGAQVFSAQYQQSPTTAEGNLIRLEWFKTYDECPERWAFQKVIQSWDTAMSASPTADYSVCLTWGWRQHDWYLIDVLRMRLEYPDLKRAVIAQHKRFRPDQVLIEQANAGLSLWQEMRVDGPFLPQLCLPRGDKVERLTGKTAQLEEGSFLLPREADWLAAFQSELRSFPFGRHDDQVDALTQFLEFQLRQWRWIETDHDACGRPLRIIRRSRRRG